MTAATSWHSLVWQNGCFGQLYCSRIEVLGIAQLLTFVSFVSVFSRERKSERIERKFKTQNPNLYGLSVPWVICICWSKDAWVVKNLSQWMHLKVSLCKFICSLKDCFNLKILSQRGHGISLFFEWDTRCCSSLFLEPNILSQYSHSKASLCSFFLWELSEICVDTRLPHSSHWNFFSPVLWCKIFGFFSLLVPSKREKNKLVLLS